MIEKESNFILNARIMRRGNFCQVRWLQLLCKGRLHGLFSIYASIQQSIQTNLLKDFWKIPVISPEYLFDSWLNRLRINWCVRPSWGLLFRANAQWAFKNQDKQTDGNKLEWSHREIVSLTRYIMSSVLPPALAQVAGDTAPTVLQQTPVRPL